MAINRDAAEWFERLDREETYGILKGTNTWLVLKKTYSDLLGDKLNKIEEVARVDSRQAAIGYIKLLTQEN